MGEISQQLANHLETRADQAEPGTWRDRAMFNEVPGIEQLLGKGHDPLHGAYIQAQNIISVFAEAVSQLDELNDYVEIVAPAQEAYMPAGPPMSPLTESYFTSWAFFDVPFGPDRETIGTCLLDLVDALGLDELRTAAIRGYQQSRMGIYEHQGFEGSLVRLRELVTGNEFVCQSTNQYWGAKGELWYVRLCPPMAELGEGIDYHITMTTPYVLINTAAEDWTAYLKKNLDADQPVNDSLHDFLKYGSSPYHWHEFIFEAFSKHDSEAIFLTGLPDVKGSLPHAS